MPLLILSYAFSIWMIVDAYKRGAEIWWKVIIFLPLGEVVYFFVVKIHDFGSRGVTFKHRCRSCAYFQNFEDNNSVQCKIGGTYETRSTSEANRCMHFKKSSWLV